MEDYEIYTHKPELIVMVGLPFSGKTSLAKKIVAYDAKTDFSYHPYIVNPDEVKEMLDNIEKKKNDKNMVLSRVFKIASGEILAGRSVIVDATNVRRKGRMHLVKSVRNMVESKSKTGMNARAVIVATTVETCLKRSNESERPIKHEKLVDEYEHWQTPWYGEGFDEIKLYFNDDLNGGMNYVNELVRESMHFDQKNKNHSKTLYDHNFSAGQYCLMNGFDEVTYYAAKHHDLGKMSTRCFVNIRGYYDGDAHYYSHHNIGAYLMLFIGFNNAFNENAILMTSVLINYHMNPYISWEGTDNEAKDRLILGEKMYELLLQLCEADRNSK